MKFGLALLLGAVAAQDVFEEVVEPATELEQMEDEITALFDEEDDEEENEEEDDNEDEVGQEEFDQLVAEDDLEEDLRVTWSRKDANNIKAGKKKILAEIEKLGAHIDAKALKGKLQRIGGSLKVDGE